MAAHAGRGPVDPQGNHPTVPLRDRVRKARAARARPGGRPRQAPATLLAHAHEPLKVIMDQENAPPVPVVNASLLLSAFGYWPTFHDGEVHRALLDRGGSGEPPSMTLVIHAFDTDNTVDEKGLPCDDERSGDPPV